MGSLSQLVNTMLGALPSAEPSADAFAPAALAPAVRRLLGAANPPAGRGNAALGAADDARAAYRAHLVEKYVGPDGSAA